MVKCDQFLSYRMARKWCYLEITKVITHLQSASPNFAPWDRYLPDFGLLVAGGVNGPVAVKLPVHLHGHAPQVQWFAQKPRHVAGGAEWMRNQMHETARA